MSKRSVAILAAVVGVLIGALSGSLVVAWLYPPVDTGPIDNATKALLVTGVLTLSSLTAGTTMFLSVQHRSAEIALRRAMGASRGSVFRLFAVEGIAIGIAGGILGTALGIGLTMSITYLNHWPLALGLDIVAQGVLVGLLAGTIASIVPATYASRRDPAQILRAV